MNKVKRILAIVLAMAMVMAMNIVSFAAEGTSSITVNGLTLNDGTTLKIYRIVSFNAAESKWEVADWAKDYVNDTTDPYSIDWNGLSQVAPDQEGIVTNEGSYTFTGLDIGAYMILAAGKETAYNVMGTATYAYDNNNNLIGPDDVVISAKGQGYTVKKDYSADNLVTDFAKIGDTIKFDITTVFPSYPDNDTNRTFTITDTPTGMKITSVKVFVNSQEVDSTAYSVSELGIADKEVTVTFSAEYIGNSNLHAGENVRVEVTAVVTDSNTFENRATSNKDNNSTPAIVTGDVGSITINKKDENGNTLNGAKFEITLNDTVLTFVGSNGEYTLKTDDVAGEAVSEVEATEGKLVLKGLGAGTYKIKETVAPEGYSINNAIEDVVLTTGEKAVHDFEFDVIDTRLSELPSTGGIGTTIFTVVGCLIMIAAAAMFFVSRRRAEK